MKTAEETARMSGRQPWAALGMRKWKMERLESKRVLRILPQVPGRMNRVSMNK